MKSLTTMCFVILCALGSGIVLSHNSGPVIVSREEWGAKKPIKMTPFTDPAEYVIIHHMLSACHTPEECVKAVQKAQNKAMATNFYYDIQYNFLVGGDGRVYVGRGWDIAGYHTNTFYDIGSIGICITGNGRAEPPLKHQLDIVRQMIALGLEKGFIAKDYKLLGHRQAELTACPGDAIYQEIRTWPHFSPCPQPVHPAQRDNSTECPFEDFLRAVAGI